MSKLSTLGFKISMYFFLIVTVMGMFNAFGFWSLFGDAERGFLLVHVHSGTLGVLTVGILSFYLSEIEVQKQRMLTQILGSAVGIFIHSILLSYLMGITILLVLGALVGLGGIAHVSASIIVQAFRSSSDLRWQVLTNLGVLGLGILYGLTYSLRLAFGLELPGTTLAAHAASIEVGFLVMASVIVIENVLGLEHFLPQTIVFALYSISVGMGILFFAPLLMLTTPLFIVATILVLWKTAGSLNFSENTKVHATFSMAGVVGFLVFLIYITVNYLSKGQSVPDYLFVGSSHIVFLLITSNALFAYLSSKMEMKEIFPKSDLIFVYGFNLSAVVFAVLLLLDLGGHMAILMGIFLGIGVVSYLLTLMGHSEAVPASN